jgi:DUF1365 family protein
MMPSPRHLPPQAPLTIYDGTVMHARMKPKQHRFTYKVFSIAIDLDRLEEASGKTSAFSYNTFNIFSFYDKDHGPMDGSNIREWVNQRLEEAGLEKPSRVLLLCYPRILGYVFNPLSTYFAYDKDNKLMATLYEVRNTFGEHHTYVMPIDKEYNNKAPLRQACDKRFYVSPYMGVRGRYLFRIKPPEDTVAIRILETENEEPLLAATFFGHQKQALGYGLLKQGLKLPFLTVKIIAAIHWEALRLWLKGIPLFAKPKAPEAYSFPKSSRSE